jgi:hypothetical protein
MRSILALAALLAVLPAHTLLTRTDRDDAEYLELATRYPAAVTVAPGVEGALITPRWVLTSARGAMLLQAAKARPPLELGGRPNAIEATFIHPGWGQGRDADIALVFLRDPVTGITPVGLMRERDESEEIVFIVGHGNGRKRAGINTVDRVADKTLGMKVKPLPEASDLQGVAAASENGAPALIERTGKALLAGVFSGNDGDWQVFARVSTYADWIEETMFREGTRPVKPAR